MVGAAEGDALAVVTFHLGEQTFGFGAEWVAEVVPNAWLSRPPALPAMVAGLLDLGGVAVTILRGDLLLGLPEQRFGLDASMLIMKGEGHRVGLLTGRVNGVRDLQSCRYLPVDPAQNFQGCLRAQLLHDGLVVHLLDWNKMLGAEEQARLSEFQARGAERLTLWRDAAS
ncbi:chemotaxis protein CheW [Magnetospirillum sulfuroxidans]|uniref:Chemotaxis protein CheW n=1 Tax=Magnetospirillum sulfuroxidans TaxID=611300 RepID=A0ABS5I8Q9_9PROT|nr:chemotaxis protein CheW [Magnetospirillum sulfuroxidans]MBR9970791.1 chemotaxis protein CheW [Magnetospirillum sulfuroxidans]